MAEEVLEKTSQSERDNWDIFFGIADKYIEVQNAESSRETTVQEPVTSSNTDTIKQPVRGATSAGETIVVKDESIDLKKVALYLGIGSSMLLVFAVTYKMVK